MRKIILSLLGCMMVTTAFAQLQLNRDPQNIVDPTGFMRVLAPPVKVEGSAKMFDQWKTGNVYLSEGKYAADVTFNYDLVNHMLTVLVEGREYSLNPVAIDSIQIYNSTQTLVNPMVFKNLGGDLLILKIYESPNLGLYRKTQVEIMKPNYNEILNVGNRNYQIDQDYTYLFYHKVKDEFIELQGKKKDFKDWAFGDQVVTFIRNQHLDLKNEAHLIRTIEYYQQLAF